MIRNGGGKNFFKDLDATTVRWMIPDVGEWTVKAVMFKIWESRKQGRNRLQIEWGGGWLLQPWVAAPCGQWVRCVCKYGVTKKIAYGTHQLKKKLIFVKWKILKTMLCFFILRTKRFIQTFINFLKKQKKISHIKFSCWGLL